MSVKYEITIDPPWEPDERELADVIAAGIHSTFGEPEKGEWRSLEVGGVGVCSSEVEGERFTFVVRPEVG